jgi:hypothetical protein
MHGGRQRLARAIVQYRGDARLGGDSGPDGRSHVHRYFSHSKHLKLFAAPFLNPL